MRFTTFVLVFIVIFGLLTVFGPYDSTDNEAEGKRSGMILYTDNETGCQYVSNLIGGLTPRIDSDGSHKGCKDV